MNAQRGMSRRDALKTGAAIAAGAAMHRPSFAANDRLDVAFIGVGGRGGANLRSVTKQTLVGVNVVALCDVNNSSLGAAAQQHPGAKTFSDFRRLYDDLKNIDAVVVSTTEHTHAFATLPALQLKKPVYCEKPLTHNIGEARRIMQAAKEAGVPTQMGTQIHASSNYRRIVELVQAGAIGPVREAHVWVGRAWGLQSEEDAKVNKDIVYVTEPPTAQVTPPPEIDWDLWIGPAPMRPYSDVYLPGPKWYRWWDFGSGTMSDLGSHFNDLPFWALNLEAPTTIEAFGPPPHVDLAPASMSVRYEFPARGDMPACTMHWYQGTHKPQILLDGGIPSKGSGMLFIGDNGMLLCDYGTHTLLPTEKFKDFQPPKPTIPDSPGQHEEWVLACKNGTPTSSPFSYAGLLTITNHLGNVAYRAGKKLEWDHVNGRVRNAPEAEQFVSRKPREGWSL
ncbi:Inositol 2-dehydrogenase [Caulifigura coniformis]|uniref:Inositol 2-dehydrogenase n=1 Tax=Caulifigura coniformis TaxID=2527983 RepID=A0A517S9V4_9PLAN|nr:Gfo/Idh/MocA family oxidoreductase [Caulifigura coniformis]QDT52909.1 Inositol 2-dehydrogenase [Caulifigura coniformis]